MVLRLYYMVMYMMKHAIMHMNLLNSMVIHDGIYA